MRAAFGVRSLIMSGALLSAVAYVSGQTSQSTATWVDIGPGGAVPVGAAAVALADGRTLLLGGLDADGAPSNAALLYDPTSRSLVPAGVLLAGRTGHTATALSDGRIVVSGGVIGNLVTGDVELFDLATGTSSLAAILPEPRRGHVAARLAGDAVLVAGGSGVDGAALQTAVVVDASTGVVTALTGQLSVARVDASATTLIDGRVLVAGGNDGTTDLATAEIYEPFTETFSPVPTTMSVPRRGHGAVLLPHNASVLIAGGTSNGAVQAGADLFLPAAFPDPYSYSMGQFAPTGAMTAARMGGVTTSTGVEGLAIADGGGVARAEVYRFATIRSDKDDYAPGEPALLTGSGWQPGETVRLLFQEDPPVHDDYVIDVVADQAGNLRWDQWAPEYHDLGVRFYLLASGSAAKAQTTFTDALRVDVQRDSPSGSTQNVATGSSTPVTFRIENNNNNPNTNTSITVNYTLSTSGVSASGAPLTGSVTLANSAAQALLPWTITAPTGPVSGATVTLAAAIVGCPSAGNVCASQASYTFNVAAPVDSTPPVISPNITGALGSNGWYTSNVGLTWTVTDAESAVSSSTGCGSSSIVTDTAGTTFTCSATSAGGTDSASVTIKRDASAPNAPTVLPTPAPNASGWNNTDVTVAFASAGDNGPSGVESCTASTLLTAETTGTDVSGTCTDNAGNVSTSASVTVKIDKTAPGAPAAEVSPTANANGWHNTDVTVTFTAGLETGSGIASCAAPTTLSAETPGTPVSGTCTDNAGNTSSATTVTVKIDKTAPEAPAADVSPAANASGWHKTDVTVSFTAGLETGSGIASCTAPTTLTAETPGTPVSGTCTDNAGNTSTATTVTVKIDKTAPNPPTATSTPPANAAGWNNADVTISFDGAGDNLSGVASCSTSQSFTAETSGTPASGTCTDLAGNVSAATTVTVRIDKTAPTIALNPAADACDVPGLLGWCRGTQTAGFTASDPLSGLAAAYASPFTKTTAVNGDAVMIASGQVCDVAGNCAASVDAGPFTIDSVSPVLARHVASDSCSLPGASGWCRGTQTAGFAASDVTSGLPAGTTSPFTQSTSTNGGAVTIPSGQVCDVAGNCAASIDAGPFAIDSVAPGIALASRLPAANGFGWNNSAVTVTWTCTDGTSGPSAATVSATVGTEGADQSATGTCLDVAGNSASDVHGNISIDTTAPVVTVTGVSQDAVYTLGAVPAAACSTADPLSGVNTSATLGLSGGVPPGVGTFTAACTGATDKAGNAAAAATVTYKVQFAPAGTSCLGAPAHQVLQPVNADGTSVFKQKSTVPVKFRVCDANGVSIGTDVVASFALVQIINGAVASDVNEDVQSTTPDTTFRFDPTDRQWIFNTNTKSLQASRTYRYWVTLTDGSRIEYQFGLK